MMRRLEPASCPGVAIIGRLSGTADCMSLIGIPTRGYLPLLNGVIYSLLCVRPSQPPLRRPHVARFLCDLRRA